MAESNVSALAVFDNGAELSYVEKDGEILFTAEEIGRHLGYNNPANGVHKLFNKNRNELKLYTVSAKLASTDGKYYETRLFSEEAVYILSMLARTNEAKKFRARVALLLRRLRQEAMQRQIELARELAFHDLQNVRQTALQEGLRLHKRLTPERKKLMRQAVAYRKRGFSHREIGKMLDCSHATAQNLLQDAALIGQGGDA